MIQSQRYNKIVEYVASHDYLIVDDAVRIFEASPATIRRDFNELAEAGMVERIRGGIRQISPMNEASLKIRELQYSEEKRVLVKRAVELIKPGSIIFVDGGTTTSHLGTCLPGVHMKIITNSLRLATLLEDRFAVKSGPEVFMTGGFLYLKSGLLLGPNAETSIAQYHADIAFLSAGGVDENGIYNNNELVTGLEKVMIQNARKTVVLADCSKIGRQSMCHVCGFDSIHTLITNKLPENSDILSKIGNCGVEVIEV